MSIVHEQHFSESPEYKPHSVQFAFSLGHSTILFDKQDACYTGITRDAAADSFIPTVCLLME